jgi:hypothetical protein
MLPRNLAAETTVPFQNLAPENRRRRRNNNRKKLSVVNNCTLNISFSIPTTKALQYSLITLHLR